MRYVLCVLGWLMLGATAQAGLQTGFNNRTLDAVYYLPDSSTPYNQASFTPETFVVGSGIETIGNIENVTTLPVDFTDTRLTITLNTTLASPTFNVADFNGIIFSLQSPGDLNIAGASVNTSTTLNGFDDGRVTFSGTQIGINWNGLSYQNGNQVVVDFTFSPTTAVPEPSTFLLGLVGLACLGFLANRRRVRPHLAG